MQRHLQLRIEAQGKYLQAVLEKAQETLGRQNLGTAGLEAAKVQLSELVSKVSTQCLNSTFSDLKDLQGGLCPQQPQANQPTDCSMDSCLTSCEGSQKDQEIHNVGIALRPFHGTTTLEPKEIVEEPMLQQTELKWGADLKESKFLSSIGKERCPGELSIGVRSQGEKANGSCSFPDGRFKIRNEEANLLDQTSKKPESAKPENGKLSEGYTLPYFSTKLDLNTHDHENDAATSCKQFDLNGFSWSWAELSWVELRRFVWQVEETNTRSSVAAGEEENRHWNRLLPCSGHAVGRRTTPTSFNPNEISCSRKKVVVVVVVLC